MKDSSYHYDFGTACYFAGIAPEGRKAIDKLVENNDFDLIGKVLKGANNEGKIYEIEALLKLSIKGETKLTTIVKEKIKQLINLDYQFSQCSGCFVSRTSIKELFRLEEYIELLNKNKIELN